MIRCKDSVRFSIIRIEMWAILEKIHATFKRYGYPVIITCGTEAHGPDDPHTHGFALDFRSKHIDRMETKQVIRDELADALGSIYTVIFENPGLAQEHFHIQVRKGLWRTLL